MSGSLRGCLKGVFRLIKELAEINGREAKLYAYWRGRIPEANNELNSLQREKIEAVFKSNGKAFIGKVNYYNEERNQITAEKIYKAYGGQKVYNFEADFVVPVADKGLAGMITQWNTSGLPKSLKLITRITNRIEALGGANLNWS